MLNYLGHIVAFIAAVIAIKGKTWNEQAAGFSKITNLGYVLIILALLGAIIGVRTTYHSDEDLQNLQSKLTYYEKLKTLSSLALAGNFDSYKELSSIANENNSYSVSAQAELDKIQIELSQYEDMPVIRQDLLSNNKPFEVLNTQEMFRFLQASDINHNKRKSIMTYIKDKPKKEVLQQASSILEETNSLYAVAATCGILRYYCGPQASFMDTIGWRKYCKAQL